MNKFKDFCLFLKAGWWLFGIIYFPIVSCFVAMLMMALQVRLTPELVWSLFIIAFVITILSELLIYLVIKEE